MNFCTEYCYVILAFHANFDAKHYENNFKKIKVLYKCVLEFKVESLSGSRLSLCQERLPFLLQVQ
jgi:hypothetical protein